MFFRDLVYFARRECLGCDRLIDRLSLFFHVNDSLPGSTITDRCAVICPTGGVRSSVVCCLSVRLCHRHYNPPALAGEQSLKFHIAFTLFWNESIQLLCV